MLWIDAVEKQFAGQTVIYPELSLQIVPGEFMTLLGPSGCGKTTLLRMIAGLEQPSAGSIYLDGVNMTELPPYRRDVNLVFQNYALFPHMTVEQNIVFGLKMKKVSEREQKKRLDEALELTQLGELRNRLPQQLSGGQQQRVAIARAIVGKPKVLLLDEPLAALDLQLRKSLQLELKQLQSRLGMTFVYVTHDQEEALAMSDRIVVMNEGRIEQIGNPEDIYYRPQTRFVAGFIGDNNIFELERRSFAVRPENIRLKRSDEAAAGNASASRGWAEATVEELIFMGNAVKIVAKLSSYSDKSVTAVQYGPQKQGWVKGERIAVSWNEEDEVVLRP
ncbi:ABC transporter ATP-binding protein [Paenibacillus mesophilus]|nr:ABC transporter ATP-binding protein [Paenibacillus mesophilus]